MLHPAVVEQDLRARNLLAACRGPLLTVSQLADIVYGEVGLDGERKGAEARIADNMSRRRQSFSQYGNPIDLNAVAPEAFEAGCSGVYMDEGKTCAVIAISGHGFAVSLSGTDRYGVIHDYGGVLLLHTCSQDEVLAYRRQHVPKFDANKTPKKILPSSIEACKGIVVIAALAQFAHRSLFTPKGSNTRVIHDVGHETVDGDRWRMQALLGEYLKDLFPNDVVSPEDKLGGRLGQMRLDYYIPSRRLAVEYDGEQHDAPVDFSGRKSSKEALAELSDRRARDKKKAKICASEGIVLVRFGHRDRLTRELVAQRIVEAGVCLGSE